MLDDFTPIIHHLPGRTIKVYAIADVHIGARECDLDGFKRFLRRVEGEDDSYIVICGDVLNNGLRSPQCPTDIYHETMPPHTQVELAAELLKPVAGKILGCVAGNHERRTSKAVDVDLMHNVMILIDRANYYRPNMAFIRVILEHGKTKNRYALLLIHGKTANKRKTFDYAIDGVDAIIGAHLHTPTAAKNGRIVFNSSNKVSIQPFISLTASSWLKYSGYAMQALMLPNAVSDPQALILEYSGTNDRNGDIRLTW